MNHNKTANNIALIGFSTTGKTLVARKVAEYLKWDYFDIDNEIVKVTGKSIPEIFDQNGEAEFRQWESKLLKRACEQEKAVISTS